MAMKFRVVEDQGPKPFYTTDEDGVTKKTGWAAMVGCAGNLQLGTRMIEKDDIPGFTEWLVESFKLEVDND